MKVMILGASPKEQRYSYLAWKSLLNHHYKVELVSPRYNDIEGVSVHQIIPVQMKDIHTLTLYVNPKVLKSYAEDIISLAPKRVIFNPGTEDDAIKELFEKSGIQTEYACTLVLLNTNQFERIK